MRKAVIDMGTNSTRLAIGEQGNGAVQIVYTQVAETRLGEGMGTERIIQPEPLKRNIVRYYYLISFIFKQLYHKISYKKRVYQE